MGRNKGGVLVLFGEVGTFIYCKVVWYCVLKVFKMCVFFDLVILFVREVIRKLYKDIDSSVVYYRENVKLWSIV